MTGRLLQFSRRDPIVARVRDRKVEQPDRDKAAARLGLKLLALLVIAAVVAVAVMR